MKIVIFGLTISSSWGNGHATLWRGLCRAFARRGHTVGFFEHDVPYYSMNRDLWEIEGGELVLYDRWEDVSESAKQHVRESDVAIVTSYCPDGIAASDLVCSSARGLSCFYDMDTPVTLRALDNGEHVPYLAPQGLGEFDLVLSYTGGKALDALRTNLGARRVAPLYGSVDPDVHAPAIQQEWYRSDLSYLGTYAADRQDALETLFIEPARKTPNRRFLIGGAQYPEDFPWAENIYFVKHLPPSEHPSFYSSSRLTLNVTREAMAEFGYCPSGRLFEAAACGVPIISDVWEGFEEFFTPGREILTASTTADTLQALELGDGELTELAARARERTLSEHTADQRAIDFERIVNGVGRKVAAAG